MAGGRALRSGRGEGVWVRCAIAKPARHRIAQATMGGLPPHPCKCPDNGSRCRNMDAIRHPAYLVAVML